MSRKLGPNLKPRNPGPGFVCSIAERNIDVMYRMLERSDPKIMDLLTNKKLKKMTHSRSLKRWRT